MKLCSVAARLPRWLAGPYSVSILNPIRSCSSVNHTNHNHPSPNDLNTITTINSNNNNNNHSTSARAGSPITHRNTRQNLNSHHHQNASQERIKVAMIKVLTDAIARGSRTGSPLRKFDFFTRIVAEVGQNVSGEDLDAVLPQAATYYYYEDPSGGERRVVPCDWDKVLRRVAARLPLEGVTESEMCRRLREQALHMPSSLSELRVGELSFPAFLQKHFDELFFITVSNVTGKPVYHSRERNLVESSTTTIHATSNVMNHSDEVSAAFGRALDTLGLTQRLPVWTDIHTLEPLLPSSVQRASETLGWTQLLRSPGVQADFDVRPAVSVRLSLHRPRRALVLVDIASLPTVELRETLLRKTQLQPGSYHLRVLVPAGELAQKNKKMTAKAEFVPSAPSEDVEIEPVDVLLESYHLVGALISNFVTSVSGSSSSNRKGDTQASYSHLPRIAENDVDAEDIEEDEEESIIIQTNTTCSSSSPSSVDAEHSIFVLCGEEQQSAFVESVRDVVQKNMRVCILTEKEEKIVEKE